MENTCKECKRFEECSHYTTPNESFPEIKGGCPGFDEKSDMSVRMALDRINCRIVEQQDELIMQAVSSVGFSEITLDRSKVVEAFTKYTAKKPTEKFPFDLCPSCNEVVSEHNKFCSECGQKLDWSDEG